MLMDKEAHTARKYIIRLFSLANILASTLFMCVTRITPSNMWSTTRDLMNWSSEMSVAISAVVPANAPFRC